jgi:ABC-type antimicrobial peptide transport system permease subunit
MNLRSLSIKNTKFHARSYLAYFLSCTFSVWLLYLFLTLLFHPMIGPNHFQTLMTIVAIMIVMFAILFIGYSQSAFLRNRKQDLGLLQCLGMSARHVTRIIFWENLLVGSLSIILGIVLGLITSKFFFFAISSILDLKTPIQFEFSFSAIFLTAIIFLFIFSFLSWWSRFTIRKLTIAELFRESVKEKPTPTFSTWKVIISLSLIGIAYYLAWKADFQKLLSFQYLLALLLCILIGTKGLFSQLGILIIDALQKRKGFYYRGNNLPLLAGLRFRLRDHSRILFMVSILSSIIMTSVGVTLTYYFEVDRVAKDMSPFDLSIQGEHPGLTPAELQSQFKRAGLKLTDKEQIVLLPVDKDENKLSVMAQSDYNRLVKVKEYQLHLQTKEGAMINETGVFKDRIEKLAKQSQVRVSSQKYDLTITKQVYRRILNDHPNTMYLLVVNDQLYSEIKKQIPKAEQITVYAYRFADWKQGKDFLLKLEESTKGIDPFYVRNIAVIAEMMKEIFAPLMFVSLFIGILFFLASGSILYFRLFTELSSDLKQIEVLTKLGIRQKEAIKLIRSQIRILFFSPFLIGIFHATVAMNMFSSLFKKTVWDLFGLAVVVYLIVYGLYYVWTQRMYIQNVLQRVHIGQQR